MSMDAREMRQIEFMINNIKPSDKDKMESNLREAFRMTKMEIDIAMEEMGLTREEALHFVAEMIGSMGRK